MPTKRHPRQDRQLPDQRSRRLLPRPGARRLRPHVEHALPAGEQAAGAQGVGRPRQAGLLRPPRDLVAFALRHHAPHLRDHPAGRRLGQGLEPDPADRGQLRRGHRAQLRRARRRAERPVRHRPRDRLLRPRGEGLGLPGRVRLSERDLDRAGQHRRSSPARRAPKARKRFMQYTLSEEGQQLLLDPKISRLPVLPATLREGAARAIRIRSAARSRRRSTSTPTLSESRYYVVSSLFDQIITFRHKELQAATKAIQDAEKRLGGTRQPAARGSEEARLDAAGRAPSRRRTRSCSRSSRRRRATTPRCAARRRSRRSGAARPKANYARAVELANRREMIVVAVALRDRGLPRRVSSSSPVAQRLLRRVRRAAAGGFTLGALRDASSRSR